MGSTFMTYSGSIAPALGHEPVDLLDAALGVLAVPAHVPLSHRAVRTGHRIGTPDDADDKVTLFEPAARARVHHPAEGFVAEHEACLARRGPTVLPLHDLDIGPADPDGDGFDEYRTFTHIGLRNFFQLGASRLPGLYSDCLHAYTSCRCTSFVANFRLSFSISYASGEPIFDFTR